MCYKVNVSYKMEGYFPEEMRILGHDEYNKVGRDINFVWIVDESFFSKSVRDVWPAHEHNQVIGWRCLTDAYGRGWTQVWCAVVRIVVSTMKGEHIFEFDY